MNEEIYQSLTESQAKKEASKAKKNLKDCAAECPVGVDLVNFVNLVKEGNFEKAADLMYKENPFPCVTGRLCSAPCETKGTHSINIKALERFIGDNFLPQSKKSKKSKHSVAVIGTGISGMIVANTLIEQGIGVTMIESQMQNGGFLQSGIPTFRLPRAVLNAELERVIPNVTLIPDKMAGSTFPLEDLAKKYDAVVICTGASKPIFSIPGEQLLNVYTPLEFYHEHDTEAEHSTAIVIGGSNTALDAALVAKSRGSDAMVIHHEQLEEQTLDRDLFSSALKQGVKFLLLTRPTQLVGNTGLVTGLECQQMRLADDYEGGRTAVPIDESVFTTECDHVVLAQGFEPNPTISIYSNLRTSGKNKLWVGRDGQTTMTGVFAAGGIVLGFKPLEKVVAHAKDISSHVLEYLKNK